MTNALMGASWEHSGTQQLAADPIQAYQGQRWLFWATSRQNLETVFPKSLFPLQPAIELWVGMRLTLLKSLFPIIPEFRERHPFTHVLNTKLSKDSLFLLQLTLHSHSHVSSFFVRYPKANDLFLYPDFMKFKINNLKWQKHIYRSLYPN